MHAPNSVPFVARRAPLERRRDYGSRVAFPRRTASKSKSGCYLPAQSPAYPLPWRIARWPNRPPPCQPPCCPRPAGSSGGLRGGACGRCPPAPPQTPPHGRRSGCGRSPAYWAPPSPGMWSSGCGSAG
eukprot:298396-Prorocentrum_minimum.AAC.2